MIEAQVVCDSISEQGKRLTTFKLRYPKFIHGEFMTHRVISRNASSSRAIPTARLIEEVRSDALQASPVFWGRNQKGMQAVEELDNTEAIHEIGNVNDKEWLTDLQEAKRCWAMAAYYATTQAERMERIGVHKQIVNRLLEPFSHINVVATATEWDNFFGLRLHKDAQPEMRALAIVMWEAKEASTPKLLKPGQWHLPFVNLKDETLPDEYHTDPTSDDCGSIVLNKIDVGIRISVARCARVSYESFETGKRSMIEEDLKLYDRLVGSHPMHASPAEHQATPDHPNMGGELGRWQLPDQHGNFIGWRQYRKMLKGEAVAPIPEEFLPF